MTEHDDEAGPQDFDEEDPASAPESDPDPLLPLTVENRLGAVLDHAGSMVGRAHERGLLFYPGQNRGFLVRKMLHPSVEAPNSRGRLVTVRVGPTVISASDAGVPDDHVPMGRNVALEQPPPAIRIQLEGGLPVRGQPLPRVPDNSELQRVVTFSGFGGSQEGDDHVWSESTIRAYLHGKRTRGGAAESNRWDCQACYDRMVNSGVAPSDALRLALSASSHSVSETTVESGRDADEFRKGMRLMARVQGLSWGTHLHEVNIGHVPVPGGRRRVGDVMPHWARVVQMIRVLRSYNRPGPGGVRRPPLSFVAMASHGWTEGTQLGLTMSPSDNEMAHLYTLLFLRELAHRCLPDLTIIIYGCSAGGESKSFGSRSIGRWIADTLRGFNVERPRVDAHTVVGHTFKAPWLRRFEPQNGDGGSGGVWIVPPPSVTFADQRDGEHSELRKLRKERLDAYRQRARSARNYSRMMARSSGYRRIERLEREQFRDAQDNRFATAEALRNEAIRTRSDQQVRSAIQKYRDIIFKQEEFLFQHGVSPSDSMLEVLRLNHVDAGDPPVAADAADQSSEANNPRWMRWQRALQLVLDGLNFCTPMMIPQEIARYIDGLPGAAPATPERNLERAVINGGEPHFWFYSQEYGPLVDGERKWAMAPEGEYFGTIPGNWNDRPRRPRRR